MADSVDFAVVIAIDFGTSTTGFCFAAKSQPDSIFIYGPDSESFSKGEKVPTAILFDNEQKQVKAFGLHAQKLGMEQKNTVLYENFKMHLHRQTTKDPVVKAANRDCTMKLSELVAHTLRYVSTKAKEEARKQLGIEIKPYQNVLWVLTVPAIWTPFAQGFMRKAAYDAQLIDREASARLVLSPEPEAAALAACNTGVKLFQIEKGTKLMIVDCGGGTVDIAALEVEKLDSGGYPVMKALISEAGGPWGAKNIDLAFEEKLLKPLLGSDWFSNYERSSERVVFNAVTWAEVKFSVDPEANRSDRLPVYLDEPLAVSDEDPDLNDLVERFNSCALSPEKQLDTRRSKVFLTRHHLNSLFDETLGKIEAEVKRLLKKPELKNASVVIAGGFGECKLLYHRLHAWLGTKVRVIPSSGVAVLKGAVIYGLRPRSIGIRVMKASYGVKSRSSWTSEHAGAGRKKHTTSDGREQCDVFSTIVQADQSVEIDHRSTHSFIAIEDDQEEILFAFYTSNKANVKYCDEPGVEFLGDLTIRCAPPGCKAPASDREADVTIHCGAAEIYAVVKCKLTNTTERVVLKYNLH